MGMVDVVNFFTLVTLTLLLSVFLLEMLRVHVRLACLNLTTIEDLYDNMRNPFDQGSAIANLSQVFGSPHFDWILPIAPRKPLSDGVSYRIAPDECQSLVAEGSEPVLWEEETESEQIWRLRYGVKIGSLFDRWTWSDDEPASPLAWLFAC